MVAFTVLVHHEMRHICHLSISHIFVSEEYENSILLEFGLQNFQLEIRTFLNRIVELLTSLILSDY